MLVCFVTLPGAFILILGSLITGARFILRGAGMMLVTAAVLVFITFRAG